MTSLIETTINKILGNSGNFIVPPVSSSASSSSLFGKKQVNPFSTTPGIQNAAKGSFGSFTNMTKSWSMPSIPSMSSMPSINSTTSGNFFLNVLFYFFMYSFIIFLVAVFVHFTITPVFIFVPGHLGYITIPGNTDNNVYWNNKKQPLPSSRAPLDTPPSTDPSVIDTTDRLYGQDFTKNFSFSIDLYLRKFIDSTPFERLILYKSNKTIAPTGTEDFITYMKANSSMILYLTETNDIVLSFFSGSAPTVYSCPYIKNIPMNEPFRISVIVESKLFTIYLNGKLVFQRILPSELTVNTSYTNPNGSQYFSSSPKKLKSIFLQNFNLWPRVITYNELMQSQPALALASEFNLPKETPSTGSSCSFGF